MKPTLKRLFWLWLIWIAIASCKKNSSESLPPPAAPPPPSVAVDNKECFWANKWQKTSSGYEINLNPSGLNDSTIRKGITVYVAMWTEMTTFDQIPTIFYDFTRKDSVHLSYKAIPGQLQVIAKATFDIDYESDVMIRYN